MLLAGLAIAMVAVAGRPDGFVRDRLEHWLSDRSVRAKWDQLIDAGVRFGPASNAGRDLVVFSDHQCPFCEQAYAVLAELRRDYPAVAVIYLPFPLPSNRLAVPAAKGVICAGKQGAHEGMDTVLFETQEWDSVLDPPWRGLAEESGVRDIPAFLTCMESPEVAARVERSVALGLSVGVRGTPAIFGERGALGSSVSREALVSFMGLERSPDP